MEANCLMRIKYAEEHIRNCIEIRAYASHLIGRRTEIGCICLDVMNGYGQIKVFCVKEAYRNRGIGRTLLTKATDMLCKVSDPQYIQVYPCPESLYGDELMEVEDLYDRYHSLGFVPVDGPFNKERSNYLHKKHIEKT